MGKSYSIAGITQEARQTRQRKFDHQMQGMKESFQKFNITPAKALEISSLNVEQLVAKLNKSIITSQEALSALIYRCNALAKQLNFYVDTNFTWALQTAKQCDKRRKQEGKKNWTLQDGQYDQMKYFPPLFGVPISIKDTFHVQSMITTLSICSRSKAYEPQSPLVKCFKSSGMIPFIKTTIPQFGMAGETNSNLWGKTLNPWNKKRNVGGSSGGQGSIISSRCSFIGVGSDVGGSIRIPSQLCGIFGIKPYSRRISGSYHSVISKSMLCFSKVIPLCLGPMARSARDLAFFMNIVTNQNFYHGEQDPYTKIIPFDNKKFIQTQKGDKKWRVGVINSLKDLEPSHASRRVMQQTVDLLRKQGHQVIEIEIPDQRQVIREFVSQYISSMQGLLATLQKEQTIAQYKTAKLPITLWSPVKALAGLLLSKFMPRSYFYFFEKKVNWKTFDYQEHVGQIVLLRSKWIKYWKQNKLDFVICPGLGCQAFLHGKSELLGLACTYSSIWNVLDMVAGSMPISTVKENQQIYESHINDLITNGLKEIARQSQGLPVGIQVVGLPYEEERVIGFMSYLEGKVKFYENNPLPNI